MKIEPIYPRLKIILISYEFLHLGMFAVGKFTTGIFWDLKIIRCNYRRWENWLQGYFAGAVFAAVIISQGIIRVRILCSWKLTSIQNQRWSRIAAGTFAAWKISVCNFHRCAGIFAARYIYCCNNILATMVDAFRYNVLVQVNAMPVGVKINFQFIVKSFKIQ